MIRYLDVQVTLVLIIWLVFKDSSDLFALLDCQNFAKVENGLLPMRVFGVWTCGEADGLVTGTEFDVKPRDEGMDEVVSSNVEGEGRRKGEVGSFASIEIKSENSCRVSDNCFDLDCIDEWFCQSGVLERGVVEAINVIPD